MTFCSIIFLFAYKYCSLTFMRMIFDYIIHFITQHIRRFFSCLFFARFTFPDRFHPSQLEFNHWFRLQLVLNIFNNSIYITFKLLYKTFIYSHSYHSLFYIYNVCTVKQTKRIKVGGITHV